MEKSGRVGKVTIEQGEKDTRGQSPTHTAIHGLEVIARFTEVRKGKSP